MAIQSNPLTVNNISNRTTNVIFFRWPIDRGKCYVRVEGLSNKSSKSMFFDMRTSARYLLKMHALLARGLLLAVLLTTSFAATGMGAVVSALFHSGGADSCCMPFSHDDSPDDSSGEPANPAPCTEQGCLCLFCLKLLTSLLPEATSGLPLTITFALPPFARPPSDLVHRIDFPPEFS